MPKETALYLMQLYDNGDFTIYSWTPILAKKGYKVLTVEQAQPYIALSKMGKNNVEFVKNRKLIDSANVTNDISGWNSRRDEEERKIAKASKTDEIIEEVVNTEKPPRQIDDDEIRELSVSQEDIQASEMKFIKSVQHKTTLESHMLEKYQCELPTGRLDAMKALANSMISDLAKDNRLYYVDGQITIK